MVFYILPFESNKGELSDNHTIKQSKLNLIR